MLCFIEMSDDTTKLKQYDSIEKKLKLIMVLTLQKSKLFSIIKPTNLKLIK